MSSTQAVDAASDVSAASESAPCLAQKKIKVMLVDDHPMVRQGLARLINDEADLCVCGEADSVIHAIDLISRVEPDLAIVDICMGGTDGIELIKDLKTRRPGLPTLVLSMHDECIYAERVLRAGARGYVTKQEAPEQVMIAIRKVLAGEVYVSEQIAARLLSGLTGARPNAGTSPLDRLSDRELQVFRLIGGGMSVREMADKLCLSAKTIETHREHIKEKLNLRSSSELLRYSVQYGVNNA